MIKKNNFPYIFVTHIIKEFSKSLLIFLIIMTCLIFITNYVEELFFLKETNFTKNLYFYTFFNTFLKTPSLILNLFPFIFLFASIHFFVKIIKNTEYLSLKISGVSNFSIIFTPSFFSFFLGLLIIAIISPVSSLMTTKHEEIRNNISGNNNLLIVNNNGIWIKEIKKNQLIIYKSNELIKNDKQYKLKELSIFAHNADGELKETIIAKSANIFNNNWLLKEVNFYNNKTNTKKYYQEFEFETNIKLNKLNTIFSNPDTFSIWGINEYLKTLRSRGYYGDELVIKLHKYFSLPLLLFATVILATVFTINLRKKYDNYVYAFFAILTGIGVYFLTDLSIAFGRTGKIPLTISVWLPVIIILIMSIYSLLRSNEK